MDKEKLIASLNLFRRLPASRLRQNVSALANLRPELQDELLRRVEQPLEVLTDEKNGLQYLKSEYNRDGDSYRYFKLSSSQGLIPFAFNPPDHHTPTNIILQLTNLCSQALHSERWNRKQCRFLENMYTCKYRLFISFLTNTFIAVTMTLPYTAHISGIKRMEALPVQFS